MITIGIDPGLSGACSVLDHNGLRAVFDLPTMSIPGVGKGALVQKKIDGKAFRAKLLELCPASESMTVVIESVATMGGANNAVQTQGSLLRSLGALETVIECWGLPLHYVAPQAWKRFYGLLDSKATPTERKAASLATARRLYPHCTEFKRARDHNRAESVLLAHWLMKEMVL